MTRRLIVALLFAASSAGVSGCGLLATDRPPMGGRYSLNYTPDPDQPKWQRMLFGTRWVGEGPAQ